MDEQDDRREMIDEMRCLAFTGHAFCIMAWLWRLEWIRWRRQGTIRGNSVCSTYFSIQNGCPIDWELDITRNITMDRMLLLSALDLICFLPLGRWYSFLP